jgi:hypothetical protein
VKNTKFFDWSTLDRNYLRSLFCTLKGDLVDRNLDAQKIQKLISKTIKEYLPVKITSVVDAKIDKNLIYIGGFYDSVLDRRGRPCIEVQFSYHPANNKLKLTEYRLRRMAKTFADVILHEIVHLRQFRARNFKDIPGYHSTAASAKERQSQEYFGDTDELVALSFNAACELYDRFGSDRRASIRYLNSNQARRSPHSWVHKQLAAFDWNHEHRIIKRYKKKVIHFLPYAELGKPFKTTDWLVR